MYDNIVHIRENVSVLLLINADKVQIEIKRLSECAIKQQQELIEITHLDSQVINISAYCTAGLRARDPIKTKRLFIFCTLVELQI